MVNTYDTDSIIFKLLKADTALASAISGGIYAGQRPDNSIKEDIVVNTIDITQEYEPQIGTSNINIHVPDKLETIGGVQMKIENRARLKLLGSQVLEILRASRIIGLKIIVTNQTTIRETELSQHFVNIRVDWNIHEFIT